MLCGVRGVLGDDDNRSVGVEMEDAIVWESTDMYYNLE